MWSWKSIVIGGLLLGAVTGCARIRQGAWSAAVGAGNRAEFKGTAGAGFAGVRLGEVLQTPVIAPTTSAGDSLELRRNYRTSWRPALSTGLEMMVYSLTTSQAGGGIGAHMVFVPGPSGSTSPYPAITAHLGNRGNEIFIGGLFMPADRVEFPNKSDRYRIAAPSNNNAIPDFILENHRGWHWKRPTLYVGIQIGGVRLGERSAEAAAEAEGATASKILLDLDSAHFSGDTLIAIKPGVFLELPTRVVDVNDKSLNVPVRWAIEDISIARIYDTNHVIGRKPGSTFLSATAAGIARRFKIIVAD